jgi:cell division protein FtsI (penicillin-binding protein 3)
VENATISYGHGISVTPLHLLAAVSAVVNSGVYRSPTFLAQDGPRAGRRVYSAETSAAMRRIMRAVVTSGTASLAEAPGYTPIGKTATAEKPSKGGYNRDARLSSFVGAFPASRPRYAVLVTLDEPRAIKGTWGYATAGWNAAPAFSAIVIRAAPLLDVMPEHLEAGVVAFVAPVKAGGDE